MKKLILIATTGFLIAPLAWGGLFENTTIEAPAPAYAMKDNPNAGSLATDENEALYITDEFKVVPQNIHEQNDEWQYSIDTTYPQITGENLSKEAILFNNHVKNLIETEIARFVDDVKQDHAHMQTLPQEIQKNSFKIDYDIDVFHPDNLSLISVRLSSEGMLAGRPHPFHAHQVLNFDFTHGQTLALNDLFKSANFLQLLGKLSAQQLNKSVQPHDQWMISEGTKPNLQNFKNWNIEEDAILITFDEYQVAPYYYGTLEIEIPYAELKNILSQQAMIISSLASSSNLAKN